MKILRNAIEAAKDYDTVFIDVYGVLFNGVTLFDGVPETLQELHQSGKKVVILSNTTQLSADAICGYGERGIYKGVHYDYFITSGEFLRSILISNKNVIEQKIDREFNTYKCLFMSNSNIFDNTGITKVEHYSDADLVYVAPPRASYGSIRVDRLQDSNGCHVSLQDFTYKNWLELSDDQGLKGLAEVHGLLEKLAQMDKPLLIANPDVFAFLHLNGESCPALTQGGVGTYYEHKFKGKVVCFGKPYTEIYEFAKSVSNASGKILMIGDTLWTDILGAQSSNIDSALVQTGITGALKEECPQKDIDSQLKMLISLGEKISGQKNALPTYLLDQFARRI
ncbi:MAG: hypothetical protein E7015_04060 [Alphaproteobacteria bacterium]|nr:hypothetical protein [Alphaproteobacteria bacterium]